MSNICTQVRFSFTRQINIFVSIYLHTEIIFILHIFKIFACLSIPLCVQIHYGSFKVFPEDMSGHLQLVLMCQQDYMDGC